MAPFLHLAHVNVARGDNVVLHDINLSVNTGEHIAILGPNGCGKSTLIKTITCECYPIVQPETTVSIFGRERWDLTELKKRLGVVSAELPGGRRSRRRARRRPHRIFFEQHPLAEPRSDRQRCGSAPKRSCNRSTQWNWRRSRWARCPPDSSARIMIGRALVGFSGNVSCSTNPRMHWISPRRPILRDLLRKLAQQGTGILLITHHIADIPPRDRPDPPDERRPHRGRRAEERTSDGGDASATCSKLRSNIAERDGFFHAW